ncbi:MAG: gamma-glutamyl-gamma-aminobutyrate hydrolase family protein [Rhodospirillales bacterium]|nr:gamma-glutamyl-gamma-aminobutyrate hydrolase family protein [Rhodospirillales bacterium]
MSGRPVIGVLLDYQAAGSFSQRPHYALRTGYFDALWLAGGTPVAIPYVDGAIDAYLALCDGFLFPGGFYPFPARLYGETAGSDEPVHPRFAFEEQLMARVIARDRPVLGVCAGMQVLAGLYGGTFYRDLHTAIDTPIDHLNERPAEQPAHGLTVSQGSRLQEILGTTALRVNTAHKEALSNQPAGLVINARAEDGVVEGVEVADKGFCIGVQWHPEFFARDGDPNFNLFTGLVSAAAGAKS